MDYLYSTDLFCLDQKIIDSKFLVTISKGIIIVFSVYAPTTCYKNFYLSIDYINNEYQYKNNNKLIKKILIGNEIELLKKLFIKIDDCPSWSREHLYLIRKKQLENSCFYYPILPHALSADAQAAINIIIASMLNINSII